MSSVEEAKQLICELCKAMYDGGHVSGTGGGMSLKVGEQIVMAPSGVQKERMLPQDMFVLDRQGSILHWPEPRPAPYKPPKLSECAPLFQAAYDLADAGAVLHSHSMNAVMATVLDPEATEFRATGLEMIKGIEGHANHNMLVVPIVENTARECELTERLEAAIRAYPATRAVLVRRHGVYIWGRDWVQAKTQAECYEYIFEAAVKFKTQLGIDVSKPAVQVAAATNGVHANGSVDDNGAGFPSTTPKAVVLDIEGTVAPISFVADTLFPYARERLREHLVATWAEPGTFTVVQGLREQVPAVPGLALQASEASAGSDITAVVAWAETEMAADRKTPALKTLQGHIWTRGFAAGELTAPLYSDVSPALRRWSAAGVKTYIYSSGSRQAQRDLFAHTTAPEGDLRSFLSGFFDTSSGAKVDATSYDNIALNLGVDSPGDILFATDNPAEARAAADAGWRAVLVERPGNAPLNKSDRADFQCVESLDQLGF